MAGCAVGAPPRAPGRTPSRRPGRPSVAVVAPLALSRRSSRSAQSNGLGCWARRQHRIWPRHPCRLVPCLVAKVVPFGRHLGQPPDGVPHPVRRRVVAPVTGHVVVDAVGLLELPLGRTVVLPEELVRVVERGLFRIFDDLLYGRGHGQGLESLVVLAAADAIFGTSASSRTRDTNPDDHQHSRLPPR